MNRRIAAMTLALPLLVGACGETGPVGGPSMAPANSPAAGASATPRPLDLATVVLPPDAPPRGMTLSDEGNGRAALEQLPLFPDTLAALLGAPGFVDGRWSRFAGSPEDFADSRNFVLTWVARYASEGEAATVLAILRDELEAEDHYGWGTGGDVRLGDGGTCLEGDNPQLGGLHETICLWRRETLVMIIGGGSRNEPPIEAEAGAMDARAEALLRGS